MGLIEAFVRNRVKVTVSVLLVALFGTIALVTMPTQLTPEVQIPTITVETLWPGASPQEVEREIVLEQEEQLKSVEGVTKLTSESMDSRARITLEFTVGTIIAEAKVDVLTRLQQVREYPEDADEPIITTSNLADRPIARYMLTQLPPTEEQIIRFQQEHPEIAPALEPALRTSNPSLRVRRLRDAAVAHPEIEGLVADQIDVTKLRKFAEDFIESRFERVEGVSNAEVSGGEEEEMQVIVDPQRLATRELTIADVRAALVGQNKDTSGGDFWEGKRRYVVRTLGQYRSPEQVADTIIARRDGVPVYVRDVATVSQGYKKPDGLVRRYGTSNIGLSAARETGANVLEVMEGLRLATQELNEGVLKSRGLVLFQVYDETEYIYSAIGLVQENIVIGGLLTVAVLLLFLRSGRSTLIIALAIPTSIIGTFLILSLLGRSLNVVSLAGLAFAVGMLVDNAIVVLENIYQHYQRGERVITAAVRGTHEVWGAVVASTLTTLAVFLPVIFVEEEAGQLFRDIALAISAAVGLSLIVSIVVIPTGAAAILSERSRPTRRPSLIVRFSRRIARALDWLVLGPIRFLILRPLDALAAWFVRAVVGTNALIQRSVLLGLVTVVLFVGVSVFLSIRLAPRVEYLPTGNRNLVAGILLPPPGYNVDQLREMGEQIETDLQPYWNCDPGSPEAEALDFPVIADFFFVARNRQIFMGLRAADPERVSELVPLIQKVASRVPGTIAVVKQTSLFESGLTAGRTIDIEIVGPDLPTLVATGGRVLGEVKQLIPEAQARPVPSLDLSSPEVHVVLKPEQAKDLEIEATDLGYIVDALVDGAYAGDYYSGGDKIDLTIIGAPGSANRTQDLASLYIATPTGQHVPLAALADVRLASGPEQINHRERQRAITIEVSPPAAMALEDAMLLISQKIVEPLREEGVLGNEYQINLAGTADKLQATWQALRFNVVLALLITYLLMAALFESWLYPFVIIMTVPLGAVGGVAGLWVLNQFVLQPLDVLTMLGFIILIGTVVNNPILIVHQSLVQMREEGLAPREAILKSVRSRIRPIFMTTATTSLGLLPLVLFPGAGSELYRGLGSVLLGGLIISTLFTLILVPTLFRLTLQAKGGILSLLGWDDDSDGPDITARIGSDGRHAVTPPHPVAPSLPVG